MCVCMHVFVSLCVYFCLCLCVSVFKPSVWNSNDAYFQKVYNIIINVCAWKHAETKNDHIVYVTVTNGM